MLSIGQLDRRIEVKNFTSVKNDFGGTTKTYATLYTLLAKKDYKKSDRKEDSEQIVQNTEVCFYVRNMSDVRILGTYHIHDIDENETYIIHGIKEIDGRDRFLEIETTIKDNQ